jgi:hypothetical protein
MAMFYALPGGELSEVPAGDELVLSRYREAMPLVWEPQFCGDEGLYPLIETEEPPEEEPTLADVRRVVSGYLRARHAFCLSVFCGEADGERLAAADATAGGQEVAAIVAAVVEKLTATSSAAVGGAR